MKGCALRALAAMNDIREGSPAPTQEREVLTAGETGVPGLIVFGRAVDLRPVLPILEHQHTNKFEFVLTLRGMRRLEAGGDYYTLYPHHAFVIPPNGPHSSPEEQPALGEILWFQLDLTCRDFLGLPAWEARELLRLLAGFRGRVLELPPALSEDFLQCFRLLQGDIPQRLEGRSLFVCSLIRLIQCRAPLEQPTPDIDRAKQYILLHVKEAIDLDELLLASGLTLEEFRREFQAQMGCTPRDYINRQKIRRACAAVANTRRSFADIAYEYHFSSASFFKLLFKRQTGMSPGRYRRTHRKKEAD